MTARRSRGQPRTLPLPDYDLSGSNAVALTIYGAVIDDNYTEQLMKNGDLPLGMCWLSTGSKRICPSVLKPRQG